MGSFGPKLVILLGPACPQFVISGQMIGWVTETRNLADLGDEYNHLVFGVEHVGGQIAFGVFLVEHHVEDGLGFGAVILQTFAATPAVGGKQQGGGKPFLAVGGRAGIELFAFRRAVRDSDCVVVRSSAFGDHQVVPAVNFVEVRRFGPDGFFERAIPLAGLRPAIGHEPCAPVVVEKQGGSMPGTSSNQCGSDQGPAGSVAVTMKLPDFVLPATSVLMT